MQQQLNQRLKRTTSTIPFGYKLDEDDPRYLVSIQEELEALKEGIGYLETCTQQEVASWLYHKTGRYISRQGLLKAMKRTIDANT